MVVRRQASQRRSVTLATLLLAASPHRQSEWCLGSAPNSKRQLDSETVERLFAPGRGLGIQSQRLLRSSRNVEWTSPPPDKPEQRYHQTQDIVPASSARLSPDHLGGSRCLREIGQLEPPRHTPALHGPPLSWSGSTGALHQSSRDLSEEAKRERRRLRPIALRGRGRGCRRHPRSARSRSPCYEWDRQAWSSRP